MDGNLAALEKEFVSRYLEFHPGHAAFAGMHDHDHRLEELTPQTIAAYCAELDSLRKLTMALDGLSAADLAEREILLSMIDGHPVRIPEGPRLGA